MAKEIFLIDDDKEDLQFFCDALEMIDPSIRCRDFPGCMEALDHFHSFKEPPICIFIDLVMPKVDGMDCLIAMIAGNRLKGTPFFILSGNIPKEKKSELARLGASGFVKKPDNPERLKEEISTLLLPLLRSDQGAFDNG